MTQEVEGRISPYDNMAEMSVLGSMILDPEAIDIASSVLSARDFYSANHQEIYNGIMELAQKGEAVDYVTLANVLGEEGVLDTVGGISYITELSSYIGTSANVAHYARIVKDKAILRQLIKISDAITEKAYTSKPTKEVIEYAEDKIYNISQDRIHRDLVPISDTISETLQRIEQMSMSKSDITGVTTGLQDLDRHLSGLQPSDLVLLAARPSMGKTSLGVNMAISAADAGHNVAIFSLEMSKIQLTQRILSNCSLIELQDIIKGNIEDWQELATAMEYVRGLGIYLDDTSGISLTELRSKCRRLSSQKGLDLVVIDYLQLMTTDSGESNRQQEISTISRGLKALAKDLSCPVLALSQLSRAPEMRKDHRPIMSDLRESGAIEQDADVVMMLYRDDYYNEDSEVPGITEVIVTKHRNGPTGTVELYFDSKRAKFISSAE